MPSQPVRWRDIKKKSTLAFISWTDLMFCTFMFSSTLALNVCTPLALISLTVWHRGVQSQSFVNEKCLHLCTFAAGFSSAAENCWDLLLCNKKKRSIYHKFWFYCIISPQKLSALYLIHIVRTIFVTPRWIFLLLC